MSDKIILDLRMLLMSPTRRSHIQHLYALSSIQLHLYFLPLGPLEHVRDIQTSGYCPERAEERLKNDC
jgi:hypothetical protein